MLDRIVKVTEVKDLGAANALLTLRSPEQARLAHPGQFLMVKCCEDLNENPLLRRPFSIFAVRTHRRTGSPVGLEILVKDVGSGTHKLVQIRRGQELAVLGPQGRPFQLSEDTANEVRFACLIAGGVGIAAMYLLAGRLLSLGVTPVLFYGARGAEELVLREYFERFGIQTAYTTEDGSFGERGLVTAPLARFLKKHRRDRMRIYACGPWAMMRAVHLQALRHGVPCEVSLEARMGCSLGACMGCVVRAQGNPDAPEYLRVCLEGPVMSSRVINWDVPPL
ncbi:MAG: pyrK [Acidobacteria bacterium]|nr:pyrK [Acidobacteriota bacterium]